MDSQTLWIIALSIATPIAGVVGFAIKLREVKKMRLENEKLQLEIEALRRRSAESDRRIIPPTYRELEMFGNILYSRERVEVASLNEPKKLAFKKITIKRNTIFQGRMAAMHRRNRTVNVTK